MKVGTDKIDRLYEDLETNTKNSRKIEDVADHNNNNNNNNTDSGVDLEAIRKQAKEEETEVYVITYMHGIHRE